MTVPAVAVLLISVAAGIGWATQQHVLTSFGAGPATMKLNTALGFACLAAGLLLSPGERSRNWAYVPLALATAIATMTLLEYAELAPLQVDELAIGDSWGSRHPGRPSRATAAVLLCGSLGLSSALWSRRFLPLHVSAWVLLATGAFSLVTFLLAPSAVSRMPWFESVSLPTALSTVLVSIAFLHLRPQDGILVLLRSPGVAGFASRLFFPVGLTLPVVAGGLCIYLVQAHWFDWQIGVSLLSTGIALGSVALVYTGVRRIANLDTLRATAEQQLRATLADTQAALDRANAYLVAAPGAMLVWNEEGAIQVANRQAEELLNLSSEELKGMNLLRLVPERDRADHEEWFVQLLDNPDSGGVRSPVLIGLTSATRELAVELAVNAFTLGTERLFVCGIHDVGAHLEAERATRAANARLQFATAAASLGIWEWVVGTNELIWDDQMMALYGHDAESFSGRLDAWLEALVPESRRYAQQRVQEILAGEGEPHFDFDIVARDGPKRTIEMYCAVERGANGEPTSMIGTNRDVTEQRAAEARLVTEQQRFQGIFSSMYQMTWILTADGLVSEANQTALELIDASPDDVLGVPFGETRWWSTESANNELRRSLERALRGQFVRYATRLGARRDEGTPVDLSIKPVLSEQGAVQMLIVEGRDISDAEAARAALIESEAKFRNALDYSAIGLTLVDLDGRFTRVNKALCRILGRNEEELLRLSFQEITHPEDIEADLALLRELVAGERSHYHLEKRYLRKDGGIIWCLLSVSLVRNPSGDPQYFISQIQDVTDRKTAQTKLQRSLQDKEVLLREIHHRVKNNLQIVSSILRLAQRTITDEHLSNVFEESRARVQTMAKVHEQLYTTGDLATIDFARQLQELCKLIRSSSRVPARQVVFDLDVKAVKLDMDYAIPLSLIANELISNSMKHAFRNQRPGVVQVRLRRTGDMVELLIRDDGSGLPEGFSPDATGSLGMRIVSRLTHQLRGKLEFENTPGAQFTLRFRLERRSAELELGAA